MAMRHAVKALDAEAGRVGGYLVVWGGPDARDGHGEYFTPETALGLDWYPLRPVLFHHGLVDAPTGVIGRIEALRRDAVGVYAEAVLDAGHPLKAALWRLVEDGVLAWSSGSLPHLVAVDADGRITRWPIVEGSLTPRPAERRHTTVQAVGGAYKALGLDAARLLDKLQSVDDSMEGATMQDDFNDEVTTRRLPVRAAGDAAGVGLKGLRVSSPYDTLSAADMLHGYMMLRSTKRFQGVSERYANALAAKVSAAGLRVGGESFGAAGVKADELSYSTQTGFGDEWVPALWSDQVWRKARADNVVLPLFRAVEMPSNPFNLPVEGADPEVYYVPETQGESQLTLGAGNPIPDSKVGTGQVQLVAKKLALRVGFSTELVEDAVVPVLTLYREQALKAIAEAIDDVLVNGDVTTTADTNINQIAGVPPANARYLALDGLRKLPLVTATAQAVNMAGAPTLAKLRETRFKLAARYSARPSSLAWVVDPGTYAALLDLPEFLTMDKAGALATAQTGQIGYVDGVPVLVSAVLPLTDSDGMVDALADKGTALCVYRPGWYVGYRRRVVVNVEYLPYYDSYQLTATVRLALARYEEGVASALYNVTV